MNAQNAQRLRDMILVTGFGVMLASCIYEPLMIIGCMIAVSCIIPDFLFNKCPHCGKRLGRNTAKFCQHCGKAMD